jgi:hypothetical protein
MARASCGPGDCSRGPPGLSLGCLLPHTPSRSSYVAVNKTCDLAGGIETALVQPWNLATSSTIWCPSHSDPSPSSCC